MRKPAEWSAELPIGWIDNRLRTVQAREDWIAAIQAEAYTAGAEAQREADCEWLRDQDAKHRPCDVAYLLRDRHLVTLPKGEK